MKRVYLSVILTALFFFSCKIDTGLEPTHSGFRGTVHFINDWPEQTDQVIVVAATKFPPTTITDIILGDPLPLGVDSATFTIYNPPAKFAAVGVVWKEKGQPWDVTNIIGIYFPTDNKFSPGVVEIKDRNTLVDSIDIVADLSKARLKVESTIEGKLRINGQWPDDVTSVLVIASESFPPAGLLDVTFGQPIPANFDSTQSYTLSVQPGKYKLIGCLVLQSDIPLGLESLKGIYFKRPTDFFPGTVTVPTDTSKIKNIDITINF